MPDVFIGLKEAAEFEGVKYNTLVQRIKRSPNQYKTRTQPQENGGKEQVLVSVDSLTAKGRKAWRAAQKIDGRDVVIGLSLYGVEPREPWVQFGPQLELERLVQSEREPRFPPRLVGYYVIRGYGFECVSLLYFKGEVILRLVSDGVKTVTNLRPALSYWEAGASLQCGYKPAS